MKMGLGCGLVVFILICIFGPLFLFSTLNLIASNNLVNSGDFSITLNNRKTEINVPLYHSNQLFGANGDIVTDFERIGKNIKNQIVLNANKNGAL